MCENFNSTVVPSSSLSIPPVQYPLCAQYRGKEWERWERDHEKLARARVFGSLAHLSLFALVSYHHLNEPHPNSSIAGGLILMHNDDKWRITRELFGKTFSNVAV